MVILANDQKMSGKIQQQKKQQQKNGRQDDEGVFMAPAEEIERIADSQIDR